MTMTSQQQTPQEQLLLTREASLAAMALGAGLTHMRRYNYAQTGYFFNGMYSYCVGLERALKIICIYDHRLEHANRFPTNAVLKSFSHGLASLIAHTQGVATARGLSVNPSFFSDTLSPKIISWITDYAQSTRYYNLDTLTGRSHATDEPLVRWENEVCSEIVTRHYHPNAARLQELSIVKQLLAPIAYVRHTSGAGMQLNDVWSAVGESATAKVKQKFSMYYLYCLSRFVCQVLVELEYEGNFFPTLREFFPLFTSDDRAWILARKTWDPYNL